MPCTVSSIRSAVAAAWSTAPARNSQSASAASRCTLPRARAWIPTTSAAYCCAGLVPLSLIRVSASAVSSR